METRQKRDRHRSEQPYGSAGLAMPARQARKQDFALVVGQRHGRGATPGAAWIQA